MKSIFTKIFLAGIAITIFSCKKEFSQEPQTAAHVAGEPDVRIDVPYVDGFNYKTTRNVSLSLSLRTNANMPIAGVVVNVNLPGGDEGASILKGVTDKKGDLQATISIPADITELIIDPAYVGLMRNARGIIGGDNTLTATIGGPEGFSGSIRGEEITFSASSPAQQVNTYKALGYHTTGLLATTFTYPGNLSATASIVNNSTYPKALGRPSYLEVIGDVLDASLLSFINASLPENQPLTTTHPAYLNSSVVSTLNVTAKTDIYLTFVSEGASQKNTLGYYTYPTGSAPNVGASLLPVLGGIDKITWVFPNASANGSGGGLKQGDKVKLGNFAAGTTIAFVLIKDGWNGSDVAAGNTKFYSNDSYNPGAKKQSILLYDDVHKKFVSSFEDIDRSGASSDNDFNDLVIYSSSSVAGAISTTGVPVIDHGGDRDGDGIQDVSDAFPNDPARAFISYYPSEQTFGTIAFEDQWPKTGDYDMNDLVIGFRYAYETNAQNKVVSLKANFTLIAAGCNGWKHGFGVQLPVSSANVSSVSGSSITSNYLQMSGNGVEAGQTNAVVVAFDNHYSLIPSGQDPLQMNAMPSKLKITAAPVNLNINFTTPVLLSSLPASAFNPFLIANGERGREVHLPGYKPTSKANTALFDTQNDATVPAENRYYLSLDGKPYALMFSEKFSYPMESKLISKAYLNFSNWVTSKGLYHSDWYKNESSGYRNLTLIYLK